MIGKLDRDQGSGVRDQKRNDLAKNWPVSVDAGGLDSKIGRKSRRKASGPSLRKGPHWCGWFVFYSTSKPTEVVCVMAPEVPVMVTV
jgi:hypothetical protein